MVDQRPKSPFAGSRRLLEPSMAQQARLAWRLFRDPRVTALKNVLPIVALLYVLSPIDLLPDLIPGVGQVDDAGVLVAVFVLFTRFLPRLAPARVVQEHLIGLGLVEERAAGPAGGAVYDASYRVRD